MPSNSIKVLLGGGTISAGHAFPSVESLDPVLSVLEKHGVDTIDTAEIYGESEELLGKAKAGERFTFDTKAPGGFKPGSLSNEGVKESAETSLQRLGVDKVDVYYIHAPDTSIPFDNWVPAINALHASGAFSRFGISNFKAADVASLHSYCQSHSYVLPSVYQGNYNPIARLQETLLFPTLRKLNIAFYAYSPLAGGFLTKTKQDFADEKGRFRTDGLIGQIYRDMYGKESYLKALEGWESLAKDAGLERAEVAYRWVTWNSALKKENGDGIIVGASSVGQLEKTLEWLEKGPLDEKTLARVGTIWKTIEHEAPLDNFNR